MQSTLLVALLVGLGVAVGAEVLPSFGQVAATAAGAALLLLGSVLTSRSTSAHRMWLYGWRRPGGTRWLVPTAFAALLAVPLLGFFPAPEAFTPGGAVSALGAIALLVLAMEACFRGLVHGLLLRHSRLPAPGDSARITFPAAISALLYAIVVAGLCVPAIWGGTQALLPPVEGTLLVFLAALGGGLALARARERSLSLWPGAVAQLLGGIVSAGLAALLFT
jgi:hypothetical protein